MMLRACFDETKPAVETSEEVIYYQCVDGTRRQIFWTEEEENVFREVMSATELPGNRGQSLEFENAALAEMLHLLEQKVYRNIWNKPHSDERERLR